MQRLSSYYNYRMHLHFPELCVITTASVYPEEAACMRNMHTLHISYFDM